ncbi:MAG: MFS transporter [Rhodomicrobium sp.]
MPPRAEQSRRTILFVNWAHALDHFVLLIFPTAVIAIAADMHRDYSELISLSTGAFVAFGLFALPVGWLADRFGRRTVLNWFFFGYGASCMLVALSVNVLTLGLSLFVLGIFSAIYHPIGAAIIISNTTQIGRALGINGVWGNFGAALASGITGALAAALGWRAAFFVPGAILIATGIAFALLVKDGESAPRRQSVTHSIHASRNQLITLVVMFMAAILAGGLTFNIVSIAMPKILDERLGFTVPLALTGWLTTGIFFCGALTQVTIGRLIDRIELATLFVWLSLVQVAGLLAAATMTGVPMATGLILVTAGIYGQVIINDAMIGRFVPEEYRNRVYSLRFFLGFTIAGLAVPIIGSLHELGGFRFVLLVSTMIAGVILACSLATWVLTRGRLRALPVPAE